MENCIRETFCIRGTNKLKQELGNWKDTQAQEWDTYVYRSTNTLIWRRVEGGQEKWYRHGNPTKKGGTTYNITTGVEIERPNKAIRVTLKSRSERTWVFHKGAQRSTETAHTKKK